MNGPSSSYGQDGPAPTGPAGPVGQGNYLVRPGDCVESIAAEHGLFWQTIWNDPRNSEVKRVRKDPNVLFPGDRLHVRPKEEKDVPAGCEQRHRFRKKGVPALLRLRIMAEPQPQVEEEEDWDEEGPEPQRPAEPSEPRQDEPRANLPYVLEIDGEPFHGTTDEQGYLQHWIPGDARRGKLILEPGTVNEVVIPLQLGRLDPISEIVGVKQRLNNLAFDCGDETNEMTPGLEAALRAFQEKHGLTVTGRPDPATRSKLQEVHGS